MSLSKNYQPDSVFGVLGDQFCEPVAPEEPPQTVLRYYNQYAAGSVGLDQLSDKEQIAHFAKFEALSDNQQQPLALAYHGHQFRNYNPDLGDGRGFLFAQLRDDQHRLLDLGTKGSGQTPWSRAGDGKLTLKGAVREILATEMLEALGVQTSKTFSVFETGEQLWRNDEPSPARSAVLTRLSHSHIRFGAFQRLAYLGKPDEMRALLQHIADHYMDHLNQLEPELRPMAFLREVAELSAQMCAQWMAAGFVHGVLNTDNMNINGESFDYGPWRFLPNYDPSFTAAYFDQQGLYAYGRQPEAVSWNLARLGEALGLLAPVEQLQLAHQNFAACWTTALPQAFLRRLGLQSQNPQQDEALLLQMTQTLQVTQVPFEGFFFDWFCADEARAMTRPNLAIYQSSEFAALRCLLGDYQPQNPARLDHSYFGNETPQTLLIDEVEALWAPIAEQDDWQIFQQKIDGIRAAKAGYGIYL